MFEVDKDQLERATGGRYEILGRIGEGGMGTVFSALHKKLGSKVAIKVLSPDIFSTETHLRRFKQEAQVAAQLSHPNLVPVHELDVDGELAYLVMPFIDGNTLDQHLIVNGPMSPEDVATMLRQVGAALDFAHRRGVIHRDVKPSNILWERETGRWLVTDFGVARVTSSGEDGLTQPGTSIGTPAYMAPEQLGRAVEVDGRADLFALAAVGFEALTSERPDATMGKDVLARSLIFKRPDVDQRFAHSLCAPLTISRTERPHTIELWLEHLEPGSRKRLRAVTVGVATGMIFVVWLLRMWIGQPTTAETATTPTIAVLPFAVTGNGEVGLDSILPQAFTWQLQGLGDIRVLQPSSFRSAVLRRFGAPPFDPDTISAIGQLITANQVVIGDANVDGGRVSIRVELVDVAQRRIIAAADTAGPADSLHALVTSLVIQTVGGQLSEQMSGIRASLPRGTQAVRSYFQGDRAFRRGAFGDAIQHFERVIELDSTYAPAYFKRMLATVMGVQPSKTAPAVRSALNAAMLYRDELDPVSARLLEGYGSLLLNGDLNAAEDTFRDIVDDYPDAVDAWFVLGFLRFRFASLMDATLADAEGAFQQVIVRDPSFAAATGQLAQIAILQNDQTAARHFLNQYLIYDGSSDAAQLARAVDTLLFQPANAQAVLSSFPDRPALILEYLAMPAGELEQPGGTRAFSGEAVRVLATRAATSEERTMTFRMQMAMLTGWGRFSEARVAMEEAQNRGVPQAEIDRWSLLIQAAGLAPDWEGSESAAERLLQAEDEPVVSAWIAARWARKAGRDPARFDARLSRVAQESDILSESLIRDLEALDLLSGGDSLGALDKWQGAQSRYDIAHLTFGLAHSLWPLRLDRARVALAVGRLEEARDVAGTFSRMAGFVDQAAWIGILQVLIDSETALGNVPQAQRWTRRMERLTTGRPISQGRLN